ncbi:MAG: class I SAM-dependent methyltransferase family protein [Candidatus Hodarchaeota archaeon]
MYRSAEHARPHPFSSIGSVQVTTITNPKRLPFHQFLQEELQKQIDPRLLPRRLRRLGTVAILWLHPSIVSFQSQIGQAVLKYDSRIQSVLKRTDAISGPYRRPALELIAGSENTNTVFRENKVVFHLDPMKVMFSVGNKAERLRMSKLGAGEFVVDMFAGIGQFALPIAVHARPKIIHAIEWNPDAYRYLCMNIDANKVTDFVKPHFGDTSQLAPKIAQGQANRVLMGLIQGTTRYLKQGLSCVSPTGILHIHEISSKQDRGFEVFSMLQDIAHSMSRHVELLQTRAIKTYNPKLTHFVLDVQVN